MTYNEFYKNVKEFMGGLNSGKEGGVYNGKLYNHILHIPKCEKKIPKETKMNEIYEHLILPGIHKDSYKSDIGDKLHRCAHHFNSSQIMCYNYFRPLMEDFSNKPSNKLLNIMSDNLKHIDLLNKEGSCTFEYEDKSRSTKWIDSHGKHNYESSNFDFYMKMGDDIEIFFEIKYTESSFGTCSDDPKHQHKYDNYYKPRLEEAKVIKKELRNHICISDFCKKYQLFRNVLKVVDKKKYVIFVYPSGNSRISKQLAAFKDEYISEEYLDNVIGLTWEELVKYDGVSEEFKKRYYLCD